MSTYQFFFLGQPYSDPSAVQHRVHPTFPNHTDPTSITTFNSTTKSKALTYRSHMLTYWTPLGIICASLGNFRDTWPPCGITFFNFGTSWGLLVHSMQFIIIVYNSCCIQCIELLGPLNDDTKILTDTETVFSYTKFSETETDTFFPRPNFPKPILFFRDQFLQN